jgi:hypothetical protein
MDGEVVGPCSCFNEPMPPTRDVVERWRMKVGDITVIMSPMVNFSYPATFNFVIQETNERFTSQHDHVWDAYMEWAENKVCGECCVKSTAEPRGQTKVETMDTTTFFPF